MPPNRRDTVEYTIPFDNTQLDIQLYEVGKFLGMLCNNNGNMVLLLNTPFNFYKFPVLPWGDLRGLFITKKLVNYYRGYAESQRKRSLSQRGGKALIYTYREMFEGLHVMKYGRMEFDFKKLWDIAKENNWYPEGLLDTYFYAPTKKVTSDEWEQFYSEWENLCIKLDEEKDRSKLPDSFDGHDYCDDLLRDLRLWYLAGGLTGNE